MYSAILWYKRVCTQAASEQPTGHSGLLHQRLNKKKFSRFTFKTRDNDMRLQKVKFKCDLRKYCFTTIYL